MGRRTLDNISDDKYLNKYCYYISDFKKISDLCPFIDTILAVSVGIFASSESYFALCFGRAINIIKQYLQFVIKKTNPSV
jgi:hypothetical protein